MSRCSAGLLASALGLGCLGEQPQAEPLQLEAIVESDPGLPLRGIPVYLDGVLIGESDALGRVSTSAEANSRHQLTLTHRCPEGHHETEPSRIVRVRRYRVERSPHGIRVHLRCKPSSRRAVFVVRANNGPGVRVRLDGEHVATTDSSGLAHFSRRGSPGTEYLVELDAAEDSALRPRRSAHVFRLPDSDELFIVDQAFRTRGVASMHEPRRQRIIKIE